MEFLQFYKGLYFLPISNKTIQKLEFFDKPLSKKDPFYHKDIKTGLLTSAV